MDAHGGSLYTAVSERARERRAQALERLAEGTRR
jgi:hypothetical protein